MVCIDGSIVGYHAFLSYCDAHWFSFLGVNGLHWWFYFGWSCTYSYWTFKCSNIAQTLCDELNWHFPQQELLDAFRIIYPQYWRQEGADASFSYHLAILKKSYGDARLVNQPLHEGGKSLKAPKMLSTSNLDLQQGLFRITVEANYDIACGWPLDINPTIKL